MKRLFVLFVALCVCLCSLNLTALASRYTNCADALNYMGVFKGIADEYGNTSYELGRGATRVEALVMLLRLLGEEDAALSCQSAHNFVDVPAGNWAYPYVAYAFEKGYTSGVSATEFAPTSEVNLKAFATFVLRALGYSDKNGEFAYNEAIEKAVETGLLLPGTYKYGDDICMRDDCVYMSIRALNTKMNKSDSSLGEYLISKGVIPTDSFAKISEAVAVADKNITIASVSENTVKMNDMMSYSELTPDGYVVKYMNHIAYYNPFAKTLSHYFYDENGNVKSKMITDSAAESKYIEYIYSDNGNLLAQVVYGMDGYTIVGDLECDVKNPVYTNSYEYEFITSNGKVVAIYDEDDESNYATVDYDGKAAKVTLYGNMDTYTFDVLDFDIPDVEKIEVYNSREEKISTFNYNSEGILLSEYDEKDRPVFMSELDANGKVLKNTYYTYLWVSDSSFFDARSGSDSCTINEYEYNADGDLSKVMYYEVENGTPVYKGVYTYRYFGNGKLDRVLWQDAGDSTWEQVYTDFDEYGHMKSPF